MSDNATGWSDRQRLAYLFNLIDFSNMKLDYINAPRPEGKSIGACRIMVQRLKGTLKDDIAALTGVSEPSTEDTSKKTPAGGRKRKTKDAESDSDTKGTLAKRGRKKKDEGVVDGDEEVGEDESKVKMEGGNDVKFKDEV